MPRINKRQQRELEELEAFAKPAGLELTDDENPIVESKGVFSVASVHCLLINYPFVSSPVCQNLVPYSNEDDDDSDNAGPSKKPKKFKKKKKPASKLQTNGEVNVPVSESTPPPPFASQTTKLVDLKDSLTASERKALKKAKQKAKKAKVDDLDKALTELAIQYVTSTNA